MANHQHTSPHPRTRMGDHARQHAQIPTGAPIHYHYAAPRNNNNTNLYGIWVSMLVQLVILGGVLYWCVPSFRQRVKRMLAWWHYWGNVAPPTLHLPHPPRPATRPIPPERDFAVYGEAVARGMYRQESVMAQRDRARIDDDNNNDTKAAT